MGWAALFQGGPWPPLPPTWRPAVNQPNIPSLMKTSSKDLQTHLTAESETMLASPPAHKMTLRSGPIIVTAVTDREREDVMAAHPSNTRL